MTSAFIAILIHSSILVLLQTEISGSKILTEWRVCNNTDPVAFTIQDKRLWHLSSKCTDKPSNRHTLVLDPNTANGNSVPISCDVTLEFERVYQAPLVIDIFPMSDDRVLLSWSEPDPTKQSMLLKFSIVNFSDCKKKINFTMNLGSISFHNRYVFVRKNSVQVVHKNGALCKNFCSKTFDGEGHKIGESSSFTQKLEDVRGTLLSTSVNDDPMIFEKCLTVKSEERLNASIFFSDKVQSIIKSTTKKSIVSISTAHNIPTICKQDKSLSASLNCSSGDLTSWKKLKFDYEVGNAIPYSLPDHEGYLIGTSNFKESIKNADNEFESLSFHLTRFDGKGKRVNGIKIAESRCHLGQVNVHVFQKDVGEYCMSLLDSRGGVITTQCLDKEIKEKVKDSKIVQKGAQKN